MSGKLSFVGFVCLFVWGGVEYRAEAVFLGGGLREVWVLGGGGDRSWELGNFIYWPYFGSVKVCAELRGLWISSVFSSGKFFQSFQERLYFASIPTTTLRAQIRQRSGYRVRLSGSQCGITSRDVLCLKYTELISPPSHPRAIPALCGLHSQNKKRTWTNKETYTKPFNNIIHKAERNVVGNPITYLKP